MIPPPFIHRPVKTAPVPAKNIPKEGVSNMQQESKTRKLVTSALFCALTFLGTYLSIPAGIAGNLNFGDGFLLIGAWFLGMPWGFSAAVGAALCDLASGYVIYAPATLIIKLLMVAVAVLLRKALEKTPLPGVVRCLISGLTAELVMTFGYYLYESTIITEISSFSAALVNVPFNLLQGAFALVLSVVVETCVVKLNIGYRKHREG